MPTEGNMKDISKRIRLVIAGFLIDLTRAIMPAKTRMGREYHELTNRWLEIRKREFMPFLCEGNQDKWTTTEALIVYAETVRPKTYTLYEDALKRTKGPYVQYNLYLMMQMLVGQTLHDLYRTVLNMGNEKQFPTMRDFAEFYFKQTIDLYSSDEYKQRQQTIDALKPKQ